MLENYKMSVLEYAFVKWQTRSLGAKLDRLIILLPILVCIGAQEDVERSIQNTRKIIFAHIGSKRTATMVFRRIMFKAKKYLDNSESFYEAKQRAYEMMTQNIQLFSLALDALEGIDRELGRLSIIIKKSYDESFEISSETKRLLAYQERRYFSDEHRIE